MQRRSVRRTSRGGAPTVIERLQATIRDLRAEALESEWSKAEVTSCRAEWLGAYHDETERMCLGVAREVA